MFLERGFIDRLELRAQTVINSRSDTAANNLSIFFELIDANTILHEIIQELIGDGLHDYEKIKNEVVTGFGLNFPPNFREKVRVCLSFINAVMEEEDAPWHIVEDVVGDVTNMDSMTSIFLNEFFKPLYNYIFEKLIEIDAILYLLIRFKAYAEWYRKEELFHIYNSDISKGEANLDKKLREFLFECGIDYPYSEPRSPEGKTDILVLIQEKPIPLEIKVFNGTNKAHIKSGFKQALLYADNYNCPNGYLVVFNVSEKELFFTLSIPDLPQRVVIGGKTIFFITNNINPYLPPASVRRGVPYEIDENYLIS
jgi:hypothetical protein